MDATVSNWRQDRAEVRNMNGEVYLTISRGLGDPVVFTPGEARLLAEALRVAAQAADECRGEA